MLLTFFTKAPSSLEIQTKLKSNFRQLNKASAADTAN